MVRQSEHHLGKCLVLRLVGHLARRLAKSLAIKSGQSLSVIEQEHLVNSLFACKEPTISPSNKNTFITMSVDDIDKKFM